MSYFKNISGIYGDMVELGMKVPDERFHFSVPEAETVLDNAMRYFLSLGNREYKKLPEYSGVADWLADNQGKGLFLYGSCGRGKTVLARYAIPGILLKYHRKIVSSYDVTELDKALDEVLRKQLISIDDIGTETVIMSYGKKRMAFAEIMDAAEKYGKMVIITSNLTHEDLVNRYGERVVDRIRSTCKRIAFQGKSLRG